MRCKFILGFLLYLAPQVHSYNLETLYEDGKNYFITNNNQRMNKIMNIISTIQGDLDEFSIDSKIERNSLTYCILSSLNQTRTALGNLLLSRNLHQCNSEAEWAHENLIQSIIQGYKNLEEFQSVCVHINQTKEYLICIDSFHLKNQTYLDIYQESVELLCNYNKILSANIKSCQTNTQNYLMNTLFNLTNKINQCIAKNTNYNDLVNTMASSQLIRRTFSNSYRNQKMLLDTLKIKSFQVLEGIHSNTTANHTNVIYNIQNDEKNISVSCCLDYPLVRNDITTENAIDNIDKCLGNLTTKYANFMASIIKEPWVMNISQLCYGIKTENATSVFACLEAVWLYDAKYYEEIYSTVVEKFRRNHHKLILEIDECLYPAVHDFNQHMTFSNNYFAKCIKNQKVNSTCSNDLFHFREENNRDDAIIKLNSEVIDLVRGAEHY